MSFPSLLSSSHPWFIQIALVNLFEKQHGTVKITLLEPLFCLWKVNPLKGYKLEKSSVGGSSVTWSVIPSELDFVCELWKISA